MKSTLQELTEGLLTAIQNLENENAEMRKDIEELEDTVTELENEIAAEKHLIIDPPSHG